MKVVQEDEGLRSKILDVLQLNANLLFLVFIQGQAIDGLHQKIRMLFTLERCVELREARGRQLLLTLLLQ